MDDKKVKLIIDALIKETTFTHPNINWPECNTYLSILDWFSFAVKKGVSSDRAKISLARQLSIPTLDATSIVDTETPGLFLNEGYYVCDSDILYVSDISILLASDSNNIGILIGDSEDFISGELGFIHSEILKLSAMLELAHYSGRGVVDATIKNNILLLNNGDKGTPVKKLSLSSIRTLQSETPNSSIIKSAWSSPVENLISHVSKRGKGRLLFLSGDYTKRGLVQFIKEKISVSSMLTLGEGLDSEGDIQLVDLESLNKKPANSLINAINCTDSYILILSSSRNLLELFTKMSYLMSNEELGLNWGHHYLRTSVRQLCDKCRVSDNLDRSFLDEFLGATFTLKTHTPGHGCSYCVSGFRGFLFIEENMSDRTSMMKRILDNGKSEDSAEYISDKKPMPHSMISSFYKAGTEEINQLESIKMNLAEGLVQISDVHGLLV